MTVDVSAGGLQLSKTWSRNGSCRPVICNETNGNTFCVFAWCLFYVPGLEIFLVPVERSVLTKRKTALGCFLCGDWCCWPSLIAPCCLRGWSQLGGCCPASTAARKGEALKTEPSSFTFCSITSCSFLTPCAGSTVLRGQELTGCFSQIQVPATATAVTSVRPG